jgi:hypothetical protein
VTPFAPRALDRALAAVVVAAARHYDTALSPPDAVRRLATHPAVRDVVTGILRRRAGTAGADDATISRTIYRTIKLFDLWQEVAAEQAATGSQFTYEDSGAQRRLLQYPLDRSSETLSPAHQQFVAARSMRDVEYSVFLKTCDPFGRSLQEADND